MPAYLKKTKSEILSQELTKIQNDTPITAVGPGTVARAFAEAISTQLGDFYDILDFNVNQTLLSTASGSALDLLGSLYQVERRGINEMAAIDRRLGSFIFYIQAPHTSDIVIPEGTNIYTDSTTYMGRRFSFSTVDPTVIPRGRARAYASIRPNFADGVYTAGVNTLVIHDFPSAPGPTVYCMNPKAISPQPTMESDDQYRIRIIKEIRVATGGTLEAVRFSALKIAGVRDVRIRQAPYGLGCFETIIIPERGEGAGDHIRRASEAMNETRPAGVRMFVKTPTELPMDITVDIVAPNANTNQSQDTVTRRAAVGISRYIGALLPGTELVYNQLLQIIMDSSELIKDLSITKFSLNGTELLRRNYRPAEDEQIVVGQISINIARS